VLGERLAAAGKVTATLQPCVQLIQDGPAYLPYLQVAQGGLDGAPDEALVGLPRGYVPFGDRGVLIHQPCHGRARLGRAALGRFLEEPAQLDLRLQLVLDRGPEADLLPGKRIDPAVYGDPE